MVGFVIVSHSENLAKSVVELTSIMAPSAKIAQAGGMDDAGFRQPLNPSIQMTAFWC